MESKKHVGQQKDIWNTQTQKFYNFGEGTFTPQQNGTKFALYTWLLDHVSLFCKTRWKTTSTCDALRTLLISLSWCPYPEAVHIDSTVAGWLLPGPEALNPPGAWPRSSRGLPVQPPEPGPGWTAQYTVLSACHWGPQRGRPAPPSCHMLKKSNTPVTSICTCCFYSFLSLINLLKIKVSIFNQSKMYLWNAYWTSNK